MKPQLTKDLLDRFPALYKELRDMSFECDDGWFDLIADLSTKVSEQFPDVKFFVVKEKFGALRVSNTCPMNQPDQFDELIADAETRSVVTCEVCGAVGVLRTNRSWWRTLCDACLSGARKLSS